MFKKLIDSTNKYLFKKSNNKLVSEDKKEQSHCVNVNVGNDINVEIMKDCSFDEYVKDISIYEEKYGKLVIPIKAFIYEGIDFIHSKLLKQKITIYEENGIKFYIVDSNRYFRIIMSRYEEEEIHEVSLTMDKYNSIFKITKYIHDFNLSTKECKWYPSNSDVMKAFTLDRLEAFELIKELIIYIRYFDKLKDIIDIKDIYKYTNLLEDCYYHPIISEDNLSLSIKYVDKDFDATNMQYQNFDIVLNDTKEVIGDISFRYRNSFDYGGNVSYGIKEQYRNKQYATKALKLLVSLLKNNKYDGDKDLYVSVKPDNYASEKVAKKNGGELVYEGGVPEDDILYSLDGVKEVKIYQIKM